MQLTLEEKKELSQLSGYFKKLEITAHHLGVEMDDYVAEYLDNGTPAPEAPKANSKTLQRKKIFQKASDKPKVKASQGK